MMNENSIKKSTWAGIALIAAAILISLEQIPLPLPRRDWLALIFAGFGIALAFLDTLLSGRIVFSRRGTGEQDTYTGAAGRLWGILLVGGGLLLAFLGFRAWLLVEGAWDWARKPVGWGWIASAVGLYIVIMSVIHLIGSHENQRLKLYWLDRFVWLGVLGFGLVVSAAGILLSLMPDLIVSWVGSNLPPPPPPLPPAGQ